MSSVKAWPVWCDRLASSSCDSVFTEGGARVDGEYKVSTKGSPLISYVTVVRNNEKDISRTIDSVQSQTYKNVEHIILDGASTDNTLNIINSYASSIAYFASEPDKGLYDALNKAIPLCRGELICVLNSDDWLPDNAAELVVREYIDGACLILGSANVQVNPSRNVKWTPSPVSLNSYFNVANVCHNAIYASKLAYEISGPYNPDLRIASDFKWIMSCFDAGASFIYVEDVLVNYSLGGISSDSDKHFDECVSVILGKFDFISYDEAETLLYIFYPWKEALSDNKSMKIDAEFYLRMIVEKYRDFDGFLDSLSIGLLSLERPGFKHRLHSLSPGFYRFLRVLKNKVF